MNLFNWDYSFETGIIEVDHQHRKLVGMINELHNAMKEGRAKDELSSILSRLHEYTVYHFRTEEELMKTRNYPEMKDHVKQHSDFIIRVQDLYRRFDKGEYMISLETNEFLKEWLKGHILSTDKDMGEYLTANK